MQANLIDFIRSSLNLTVAVAQLLTSAIVWMGKGEPVAVQLSDLSSPLTPASWGLVISPAITLGGLIFAFDQIRFSRAADPVYRSIGWLTSAALAAAIIWQIIVIRNGLTLTSLGVASLAVLCAALANVRLGRQKLPLEQRIRWRAAIYVGAFTGWMTVLAVANAVPLVEAGMLNPPDWRSASGSVLLFAVSVGAAVTQWQSRGSPWFALAFCWALSAIAYNASVKRPPK